MRISLLLAWCVLAFAACAREPRLLTRWRALDGIAEGAREGPGLFIESTRPASVVVEDVDAGSDVRRALVARESVTLRFNVQAFPGAQLDLALTSKPHSSGLRWRIRGGPAGDPARLKELVAGSQDVSTPWIETRVALDAARGPYQIEITAESKTGRVALAEPTILGPADTEKPNVIVYVVDCLRADRVGAYGSTRGLTPHIDALAKEGVVLEQAWSCASWTKPSVGCMLTGQLPPKHGGRTATDRLSDGAPRLAEAFARAGYQTRGLVANPVLDGKAFGFGRGFRSYRNLAKEYVERAVNAVPADASEITRDLAQWLPTTKNRPFFLYTHSLDLHYPYEARAIAGRPAPEAGASESDLYDSEIAYNDQELGKVIEGLKSLGLLENTILVVTADHGEEFGEHGQNRHGHTLYQSLLHVPLIVRLPGGERGGARIANPVSLVDLSSTLLGLVNLPPLPEADGFSLAPLLRGKDGVRPLPLFAEQVAGAALYAARDERFKAIETIAPETTSMVFDLSKDPDEKTPLENLPARAAALQRDLMTFMSNSQEGVHLVVDSHPDDAAVQVRLTSPQGFARVYLMGRRTGEPLTLSKDGRTATYDFKRSGFTHRLVAVPNRPDAPMTLSIRIDGRPADPSAIQAGDSVRLQGPQWTFRPQDLMKPKTPSSRTIRLWYQPGAASGRTDAMDPKLREDLRALGYIK
ncbi:MAG: sulfatase [Vicinamibacteria bacterium]|nr:sulfatase [Vicinamibacteria bacterium]